MPLLKKMKQVKTEFTNGSISLEELLLHIEPLLMQAINKTEDEAEVKKIINGIEKVIYTQIEPERSTAIIELIEQGISFIKNHCEG